MIKTFYVLMSLDKNMYLQRADVVSVMLTKDWKDAKLFDSKEKAVSFLEENKDRFSGTTLDYWTTREFFHIQ